MFDAAKSAAESFAAESTRVVDNAIVPASARMQMDNLANSLVVNQRRRAAIQTSSIHATHPFLAKKTGHAKTRYISLVSAKPRNKR